MTRLYPQVSAEEWICRYPSLRMRTKKCRRCKAILINNRPYRNKHSAGLECSPCACGGHPGFITAVLLDENLQKSAKQMFSSLKELED